MKKNRGQSLIEFALIIPILLGIILITIDLGRAVYYYSVLYNAAREGARYGIIYPSDTSGIITTTRNYAIGMNPGDVAVTPQIIIPNASDPSIKYITVSVAYTFNAVTPLVGTFIGTSTFPITSKVTMFVEQVKQ